MRELGRGSRPILQTPRALGPGACSFPVVPVHAGVSRARRSSRRVCPCRLARTFATGVVPVAHSMQAGMPERSRLRASEAQDERSELPARGRGQTRAGWAPQAGCRRDAFLRARITWGPHDTSKKTSMAHRFNSGRREVPVRDSVATNAASHSAKPPRPRSRRSWTTKV